jgi:hypothetical protein
MGADLSDRVREIAAARDMPESAVMEEAIERGVEALYQDIVLGQYLDGQIDREEAVELVGESLVRRADAEMEAVTEDIEWGLNA